jgi:mono/diheme cytochrome c family protein
MIPRIIFTLSMLLLLAAATSRAADRPAAKVEFNRDVRPILAANCFVCHGLDPKHREADLRLDTFEGATADRDGSRAIVPADLGQSALWERINSTDPDVVMPPPQSKKPPLSQVQRDVLKAWIEQGASYQRHWSFAPHRPFHRGPAEREGAGPFSPRRSGHAHPPRLP